MMYNKNQFKKVNDKKVLHKIKKHWVTLSIAMLGLLGGGAVTATHVSANANTNTQDNDDQAANHSLNYNQLQNQQPKLVSNIDNHNVQNDSVGNNSTSTRSIDNESVIISKKTSKLHNNIITNALGHNLYNNGSNNPTVKTSHASELLGNTSSNTTYFTNVNQLTSEGISVSKATNKSGASASTSTSAPQSASISASVSASINASNLTSDSLSASTAESLSISTFNSLSMSASVSENNYASSAYASVLAHGGHVVSVSPSVRSFMINGAATVASYNQITDSNFMATIKDLNNFDTVDNPSLASEKATDENYVSAFYNNPKNEQAMITNSEAAQGIKLWGIDPRFFTIWQATPESIMNNVQSYYEPNASVAATLTGSVKAEVSSLIASQQVEHPSSDSATSLNNNTSSTATSSASVNVSKSTSANSSIASADVQDMISTINSYNQEASIDNDVITTNLNNLNTSGNLLLTSEKSNAFIEASQLTKLISENNNMVNSLRNQVNIPNIIHNTSFMSSLTNEVPVASKIADDANLIINKDIIPLNSQVRKDTLSNVSSSTSAQQSPSSVISGRVNNTNALNNVTSVQESNHWFYVTKTCLAHNHLFSVGSTKDYSYVLHKGDMAKIIKTHMINYNGKLLYRYEISINGHNYFVTGNAIFTKNIKQVQDPLHWFYVTRTCLAHNHINSVGKVKDYSYVLHKGDVGKILKTFVINHDHKSFHRYEISINGHNYFVTGNAIFTKNEYIQSKELDPNHKAIIQEPCFMYDSPIYSNNHRIKKIRKGHIITIKRIIHIGKAGHFMTRFELTNGLFITANRKFIKIV